MLFVFICFKHKALLFHMKNLLVVSKAMIFTHLLFNDTLIFLICTISYLACWTDIKVLFFLLTLAFLLVILLFMDDNLCKVVKNHCLF